MNALVLVKRYQEFRIVVNGKQTLLCHLPFNNNVIYKVL